MTASLDQVLKVRLWLVMQLRYESDDLAYEYPRTPEGDARCEALAGLAEAQARSAFRRAGIENDYEAQAEAWREAHRLFYAVPEEWISPDGNPAARQQGE